MNDPEPQRVAVVTSGAVRVGRAISLALADTGYDLVIVYRSSEQEAREVRQLVAKQGRSCITLRADLAEPDAAEKLATTTREAFGRVDLVVNSAASFDALPLLQVDAERWDAVMAVNLRAPHLVVRALAPLLTESGGNVVNIADLSAFQAWSVYPHHSVSKAALVHLTRVQARALAPAVRVNAVAPGAVLPPEGWSEDRLAALAEAAPLERVGSPEDVAQAVIYLAAADFVTGQVIAVDGGRLLGPNAPPEG
jgi:pteridine reductase